MSKKITVYHKKELSPYQFITKDKILIFSSRAKLNSFIRMTKYEIERVKKALKKIDDIMGLDINDFMIKYNVEYKIAYKLYEKVQEWKK